MNFIKVSLLFGFLIFFISAPSKAATPRNPSSQVDNDLEAFFNSKGVVIFIANNQNQKATFNIYNADGTIFGTISLGTDRFLMGNTKIKLSEYDQQKDIINDKYKFSPEVFSVESGNIFQFRYSNIIGDKVEIFIDQEKKVKKYLKIDKKLFKVETWKNHMIGAVIDFNLRKHPIFTIPLGSATKIDIRDSDIPFMIEEIKGDWLRITCTSYCDVQCPKNKKYQGWLKWRDGKRIFIRFVYSC